MSRKSIRLCVAAIVVLGAITPAFACNPEDLKAEYRSLCAETTDAAVEFVKATASRIKPETALLLAAKAKEAQGLCLSDNYEDAMRLAVRVARALGAAEQEAGLPRDELAGLSAATIVAVK